MLKAILEALKFTTTKDELKTQVAAMVRDAILEGTAEGLNLARNAAEGAIEIDSPRQPKRLTANNGKRKTVKG